MLAGPDENPSTLPRRGRVSHSHCDLFVNAQPPQMSPNKTPTSSLSGTIRASQSTPHCLTVATATATELLVKTAWYRSIARIRRMCSGGASPGICTTLISVAMRLPHEIVEMIIAHLSHDLPSLRSCSLTCRSWYTATVPHLHHTFWVSSKARSLNFRWPTIIRYKHKLGLLPFVKTILIQEGNHPVFVPKKFGYFTLRHFSALANVQSLEIDGLDIPSFMPRIQRYFGPFLPTLRSLCLYEPKGSNRQIIFFIGLFRHLENLSLLCQIRWWREDPTPSPDFNPPLRGRLVVRSWKKARFFQDMVHLFGEIRFHAMDVDDTTETKFLLRACAKTLRVLQLHPFDPFGEEL